VNATVTPRGARGFGAGLVFAVLVAGGWTPALASTRDQAREQVEFGINVAQKGLWKEAIYRWEKAVEIDPTYAAGHNNLAIGYEHEGQFEKARASYEKALELDPRNSMIRQNYELFKEINDRANRQSPK
jgi:Tfp pilus assembly protein PilF